MQDKFIIVHERPTDRLIESWRKCLQNAEFATHYVSPEFFDEPGFRGRHPFAVLALIDGDVAAVLTGNHDGKRLRCGLSVRPQVAWSADYPILDCITALSEGLLREGRLYDLIDVFSWLPLPASAARRFACQQEEGVVLLDLSETPQSLFRRFSDNKKTNIKKSIKRGVSIEMTRRESDILAYYEITRDWSKRKQLPVPDKDMFVESFLRCDYRHLFVARHEGELLAGIVVRGYPGGVIEYAANSSRPEFLNLRPNDLLHWRVIEWAHQEGYRKYSLGGTHLFLRKFGGAIVPTYRYRFDNTFLKYHAARDLVEQSVASAVRRLPKFVVDWGKQVRDYGYRLRAGD